MEKFIRLKNTAYRVTFPIMDNTGSLVTGAAGLDSEVSKDAGTFTDCTNEATEIATASGIYYLDLTSTEMNADTVAVIVKTSTTNAKTTTLIFYPLEAGDIFVNVTQWAGTANTTSDIAIKTTLAKTTHITGFNDISQANVQTELTTYGALKPTVAARTLDVTTTGEAGVDWANIGAPTTTVALSGTTIGTVTTLTNAPPDSAGVTTLLGRVTSTLFSGITSLKEWLGLLAGKQSGNATARTEIRSTGAGSGTFDETTDSQEAVRDRGDAAWITGAGGDPWATALPGAYGAGTAGNIIGGNLNATVSSRATQTSVDAIATALPLDSTELNAIADAILKRDVTAISGEAAYSLLNAIRMLRNKWATPGGVLTVYAEDGTTIKWTRTLTTDAAAIPITGAS